MAGRFDVTRFVRCVCGAKLTLKNQKSKIKSNQAFIRILVESVGDVFNANINIQSEPAEEESEEPGAQVLRHRSGLDGVITEPFKPFKPFIFHW